MEKRKKVDVIDRKLILNDFFKVEEAKVRFEKFNGTMSPPVRRLNFERGDSVSAVVFNNDTQKVILVNQFKYPTYSKGPGWITETVAGIVGDNESPKEAVRREILEEMGFKVTALQHIHTFYVSPGGSSERIILFYAEVVNFDRIEEGGGVVEENEDIATVEYSIDKVNEILISGDIQDAKTIIGLMWLLKNKK